MDILIERDKAIVTCDFPHKDERTGEDLSSNITVCLQDDVLVVTRNNGEQYTDVILTRDQAAFLAKALVRLGNL